MYTLEVNHRFIEMVVPFVWWQTLTIKHSETCSHQPIRTRFSYPEHEKLHFFLEYTIHKKIGASLLDDDQLLLSQTIGETCLHRPIKKIGGRKDFQGECSLRK